MIDFTTDVTAKAMTVLKIVSDFCAALLPLAAAILSFINAWSDIATKQGKWWRILFEIIVGAYLVFVFLRQR